LNNPWSGAVWDSAAGPAWAAGLESVAQEHKNPAPPPSSRASARLAGRSEIISPVWNFFMREKIGNCVEMRPMGGMRLSFRKRWD
jgi:hypothetical protein